MLLTVTTTHRPATDLGYVLHKHPDRVQAFSLPFGTAHVLYPEASEDRCTAALVVDIDPVGLTRRGGSAFALAEYVNDRPYVATSFLSVALVNLFKTAMAGTCAPRPALAQTAIPLQATLPAVPARGGEPLIRRIFEPLGYDVQVGPLPLDTTRLADLLNHLYVLLPVLDDDEHYWVGDDEIEKLMRRGEGWLTTHPERELIVRRYVKHQARLYHPALAQLDEGDDDTPTDDAPEEALEERVSLRDQRLGSVEAVIKASGARRVLDLGCGGGALLEANPPDLSEQIRDFLDGLVSHVVLDDGALVVAHAGMKEAYQGRASGRVREFALYGETTGETDEFGLPVRVQWAADYRGSATVVYGHTPVAEPLDRQRARLGHVERYTDAYRRYVWPVHGVADLRVAPFHVLAAENGVFTDRDHGWHLERCDRLVAADPDWIKRTDRRVVDVTDEASQAEATAWWEEMTGAGGEGMVVKPLSFLARGRKGLVQPGVKCRFVRREPLYRVHECVFAVLALESEPVDPRL